MTDISRGKPDQKTRVSNQRAPLLAAFDELCKNRPLRPPTSTRPEVRVIRKPPPGTTSI